MVSLSKLPIDATLHILDYLSVADIHNLRLSGLGSVDATVHVAVEQALRKRIANLLHLVRNHVSGPAIGKPYMSMFPGGEASVPSRSGKCEHIKKLSVGYGMSSPADLPRVWPCRKCHLSPVDVASFTGEDASSSAVLSTSMSLPSELTRLAVEFPNVKMLQVRKAMLHMQPGGGQFPGFAAFTRLRAVKLNRCLFRTLPDGLLRLKGLEKVILKRMYDLQKLPDDMGERLPNLRFLELYKTCVMVPRSVWNTLECNSVPDQASVSVAGRGGPITTGTVFAKLDRNEHPQIYSSIYM